MKNIFADFSANIGAVSQSKVLVAPPTEERQIQPKTVLSDQIIWASEAREYADLSKHLAAVANHVGGLERDLADKTQALEQRCVEIADLSNKKIRQDAELQEALHEKQRLREFISTIYEKMNKLQSEADAEKQKYLLSENEKHALQSDLDTAINRAADLSKNLLHAKSSLAQRDADLKSTQSRAEAIQVALSKTQEENSKLSLAIKETEELLQVRFGLLRKRFQGIIEQVEVATKDRDIQIEDMEATRKKLREQFNDRLGIAISGANELLRGDQQAQIVYNACDEIIEKTENIILDFKTTEPISENQIAPHRRTAA